MKFEGESVLDDYLAFSIIIRTTPEVARQLIGYIKTLPETAIIRDRISTEDLYIVTKNELVNGWIPKMKGWEKKESEFEE